MREDHFGPEVARSYDDSVAEMFAPGVVEPAVEVLAQLAGDGRALEFAIGTGRMALPLAASGVEVCGIELSEAMVEQLRHKPGGIDLPVTIGDMASTRADGANWGIDEHDVASQSLISHHIHTRFSLNRRGIRGQAPVFAGPGPSASAAVVARPCLHNAFRYWTWLSSDSLINCRLDIISIVSR